MRRINWPYQIKVSHEDHSRDDVLEWLRTNLSEKGLGGTARYCMGSPDRVWRLYPPHVTTVDRYGFKNEDDYLMFLLRFG